MVRPGLQVRVGYVDRGNVRKAVEAMTYSDEMLMQEQNATMRDERIVAKYQGMVDVLNHLMNKHLL